jgi:hypothetical protein
MLYTARHYVRMARYISQIEDLTLKAKLTDDWQSIFETDNYRFKSPWYRKACQGLEYRNTK